MLIPVNKFHYQYTKMNEKNYNQFSKFIQSFNKYYKESIPVNGLDRERSGAIFQYVARMAYKDYFQEAYNLVVIEDEDKYQSAEDFLADINKTIDIKLSAQYPKNKANPKHFKLSSEVSNLSTKWIRSSRYWNCELTKLKEDPAPYKLVLTTDCTPRKDKVGIPFLTVSKQCNLDNVFSIYCEILDKLESIYHLGVVIGGCDSIHDSVINSLHKDLITDIFTGFSYKSSESIGTIDKYTLLDIKRKDNDYSPSQEMIKPAQKVVLEYNTVIETDTKWISDFLNNICMCEDKP